MPAKQIYAEFSIRASRARQTCISRRLCSPAAIGVVKICCWRCARKREAVRHSARRRASCRLSPVHARLLAPLVTDHLTFAHTFFSHSCDSSLSPKASPISLTTHHSPYVVASTAGAISDTSTLAFASICALDCCAAGTIVISALVSGHYSFLAGNSDVSEKCPTLNTNAHKTGKTTTCSDRRLPSLARPLIVFCACAFVVAHTRLLAS